MRAELDDAAPWALPTLAPAAAVTPAARRVRTGRGAAVVRTITTWQRTSVRLPDSDISVLCWDGREWWVGWWDDADQCWRDASSGGPAKAPEYWADPGGPLPLLARKGPPLDVARWRRARELQQQGLSLMKIGTELEPMCNAGTVWNGLQRLARWEAERQRGS